MHALSKAVTGSAVAAIPCGTDLRQIRMDVDATRIDDPVLAQEVADFTHDCYGQSRARLFMNRPTLSDEQMNDVTWIGRSEESRVGKVCVVRVALRGRRILKQNIQNQTITILVNHILLIIIPY